MTAPAEDLASAAENLRALDDMWWRGTPLARCIPGLIVLLSEYADDWRKCPEDRPGTRIDDAVLNLARAINGGEQQ
jgi:hypothetical protein